MVFDDGTFQVFFRTFVYGEKKLDQIIRIPVGQQPNLDDVYTRLNDPSFEARPGDPEYREYTREQIIKLLRAQVESCDFDSYYSIQQKQRNQAGPNELDAHKPVHQMDDYLENVKDCITLRRKIYSHRCFNFIVGYFKH